MQRHERIASAMRYQGVIWLAVLGLLAVLPSAASAQSWPGYGRDAQHNALADGPSQLPQVIRWSTPVDLDPQYSGGPSGDLYTHYGSPAITAHNTLLVPVKTRPKAASWSSAITGGSGNVLWTLDTDYALPSHNWIPPMGIVLTGADLRWPSRGQGVRSSSGPLPTLRRGQVSRLAFVGTANYQRNPGAFNSAIQISTPITADSDGNLYFGYVSSGAALPGYPNGIPSGLARVSRRAPVRSSPRAPSAGMRVSRRSSLIVPRPSPGTASPCTWRSTPPTFPRATSAGPRRRHAGPDVERVL